MSEARTFLTSQLSDEPTLQDALDAFIEGAGLDYKIEHTSDCIHYFGKSFDEIYWAIIDIDYYGFSVKRYLIFVNSLATIDPFVKN